MLACPVEGALGCQPMTQRGLVAAAGLILVVVGITLGFMTLSAYGVGCGSAFRPHSAAAELTHIYNSDAFGGDTSDAVAACGDAVFARRVPAWGAIGLGIAAALAAVAMPARRGVKPRDTGDQQRT